MRHYVVDPDNEERLLKVPPHVVAAIKAEAYADAVEAVKVLEPRLRMGKYDGGYDCCGCSTMFSLFDDAVAAIEALGGES